MRYVMARADEYAREMTYRLYVANGLQNIPQNKYSMTSLYDLLYNQSEDKDGDEIAVDIMQRAGLKFED